jgi:hypothetical protein
MKRYPLLFTTFLTSCLVLQQASIGAAADTITMGAAQTGTETITQASVNDPRVAAANFVEHVNFARVALAMRNVDLASQHITQARNMAAIIKNTTIDQQRISDLKSGRVVYDYDTEYKNHYFPITTDLIQVKEMSSGPLWASNSLAVTDADIVYLSLDLSGDRVEVFLAAAEKALTMGDLKEADKQLARLTDAVVTMDSKIKRPADKAQDNIALARNFLAMKNYDGARYALVHADDALNAMQSNDAYKDRHKDIAVMRQDVVDIQNVITKKDPTLLQSADKRLSQWWTELKAWTSKETTSEKSESEGKKGY